MGWSDMVKWGILKENFNILSDNVEGATWWTESESPDHLLPLCLHLLLLLVLVFQGEQEIWNNN